MKKSIILSAIMALSLGLSACVVDAGPNRNDRNPPNKHDHQYNKNRPTPNQHKQNKDHYSGKNDRPDTYKPKPR
ncbi:hypothetical protein [Neisseria sp. Ec49-e6-T10]|uniref:hypothetical protein n=1 Tax=Neisseria sp. Ec49-e6-T10 TaxID=3140744 RepID=UPI003EC03010